MEYRIVETMNRRAADITWSEVPGALLYTVTQT